MQLVPFCDNPIQLVQCPSHLMDGVLCPHSAYAAAYMDDVNIHSDTRGHLWSAADALQSLKQAGLTANPKRCAAGRREVQHLGCRCGYGQVLPQVEKTAAVAGYPRPKTKREVR